jgi:hypothetical protein
VLLARKGVHDGSFSDANRAVGGDDEPAASAPDQHLPTRVTAPERPGAGRERYPVDSAATVVGEEHLAPDHPGEHRPAAGLDNVASASHWYLLASAALDLVKHRQEVLLEPDGILRHGEVPLARHLDEFAVQLLGGGLAHLVGGHTPGLQVAGVRTERGRVVVMSDASHFYEHFERGLSFPHADDPERSLAGFAFIDDLADSRDHVVPGHDPLVLAHYPAVPNDAGLAVAALHQPPTKASEELQCH